MSLTHNEAFHLSSLLENLGFSDQMVLGFFFQKLYKLGWDESKATGYHLDHEYIPLLSGKKGREIASDVSVLCCFGVQ